MTREVESAVALPPCRDIRIDNGDYSGNESIFFDPVHEKAAELTYSGTTNSWNVHTDFLALANHHHDVVYFAAFKASAVTAGVFQMNIGGGHSQKIYVDTVSKWIFLWMPKKGMYWTEGTYSWSLQSGNIEITKVIFMPCLPTVVGAGFEDLDKDSDEGTSVIGKISYVPIPEFIDVGSCKLYDYTETQRIHTEYGLDNMGAHSRGCMFHNGKIKVKILFSTNRVYVYHRRFVGDSLAWVCMGVFDVIVGADYHSPMMKVLENKAEIIRVSLRNDSLTTKDDTVELILRRGENHVEVIRKNATADINMYTGLSTSTRMAEFGWNGDYITDALRDGVVAGGLYTSDRTEEFRLNNQTPEFSNHYLYMWKMTKYAYMYVTCHDKRINTIAPTGTFYKAIAALTRLTYETAGTMDNPSVFWGSTLFSDWLRREAETADSLVGVTSESDSNAYGGNRLKFTVLNGTATFDLAGQSWESKFPDGTYAIAIRTWYEGAVNATLSIVVEDVTGSATLTTDAPTITTETFYGEEWIVLEDALYDFYGDRHYKITLKRTDSNAGILYVDAIVFIPKIRRATSVQSIKFPEGVDGAATVLLKEAKQNPEYDKRR